MWSNDNQIVSKLTTLRSSAIESMATPTGVFLTGYQGDVRRNTIYSNEIGIHLSGTLTLAKATEVTIAQQSGLRSHSVRSAIGDHSAGVAIVNNTIYEPSAVGLSLGGFAASALLRNNIFCSWSQASHSRSTDSQANLNSDYNLFYRAGGGAVGQWQNALRTTLGRMERSDWARFVKACPPILCCRC